MGQHPPIGDLTPSLDPHLGLQIFLNGSCLHTSIPGLSPPQAPMCGQRAPEHLQDKGLLETGMPCMHV